MRLVVCLLWVGQFIVLPGNFGLWPWYSFSGFLAGLGWFASLLVDCCGGFVVDLWSICRFWVL